MENEEEFPVEILGWQAFVDKYKPIPNKFSKHKELMYETYGEEVEYVKTIDPRYVWTWVDGDMSSLICAGFCYVNRLGYYITEVPWTNDADMVLLSVEKECECYDEEAMDNGDRQEYGDPECDKCEGYGLITEYVTEDSE
jgi:hypothetical protein